MKMNNIILEIYVYSHGMNYKCNRCHCPNQINIKTENDYNYITIKCEKCDTWKSIGHPSDDETQYIRNDWYVNNLENGGYVLKKRPCWPHHLNIINEIKSHAKKLLLQCNHCDNPLYNFFVREHYGQKRRNYCNNCSWTPPLSCTSCDCTSDEDDNYENGCIYWWDFDDDEINEYIDDFRNRVFYKRFKRFKKIN